MTLWFEYPGVAERFDAKAQPEGECLVWTGSRMGGKKVRYGAFRLSWPVRRQAYPHRLALERKLGRALEPGERALHSCDNPPCVNPAHLRVGTQASNMADAVARGRVRHGEGITQARLTETQVREVVALLTVPGLTHQDIADRYGISRTQISNISTGKIWRRVTGIERKLTRSELTQAVSTGQQ